MFKKEKKSKKAWIKIVEAFISVILFSAVVLLILSEKSKPETLNEKIHNDQIFLLRYIELNDTLRNEILSAEPDLNWSDFQSDLPLTYNEILLRSPRYLNCEAKLCKEEPCLKEDIIERDVYSESVIITSNLTSYNPRVLKIFCSPR
ncbi:MAG: hypothetical protein KatS3mg001_513 [Candidatus Pacearchaeota archaeon]|nr:MAG: hypothetical protein KatS3mg001_513 [Candidatus Pacearchaeota archaeon]